jgi:serine carboxypeptidase-like clade IV
LAFHYCLIEYLLTSVAAGNGLTDPAIQYSAYADYAYSNKLISKAVQVAVNAAYPPCRLGIQQCNKHPDWSGACMAAQAYCQVWHVGQLACVPFAC